MDAIRGGRAWLAVALLALPGWAAADVGDALKSGWKCAKASVAGAGVLAKDLYLKGERLAALSATAGKCLASSGADQQGFALVMGAMTTIKIVSPGSLPTGQCKPAVRGAVARPFGAGLAAVMPPGGARNKLESLLDSETAGSALWNQLAGLPPPVSTYASHVDCACEFIDGGLSLADMSAVTSAVSEVSQSCGAFLDSVGLGFINDYGGKAIASVGAIGAAAGNAWEDFRNEPEPAPDAAVYFGYWGAMVPEMAEVLVRWPDTSLGTGKWHDGTGSWLSLGANCYQSNCQVDLPLMFKQCADYYRSHRFSDEHALGKCGEYRQRASEEAVALAKEWRAVLAVRGVVESKLKSVVEARWVWRLPYNAHDGVQASYSKYDNRWTTPQALEQAFAAVAGKHGPANAYADEWNYEATGAYAAAREILPNVGFDIARAADLALAAAGAGFDAAARARWDADAVVARDYWLGRWFPTPFGTGKHGCPTDPFLQKTCVARLSETFDKVCLPSVRAAHLDTPNVLAAGVRLKQAEENCRSWVQPQIDKAAQVGAFNTGPVVASLCGGYPARSPEADRCQRMVADAYLECGADAIKQGQGPAAVGACLDQARDGIRTRLASGRRVPVSPPPGEVEAPAPGTLPASLPADPPATGRGVAPASPASRRPPGPVASPRPGRAAVAPVGPARTESSAPATPPSEQRAAPAPVPANGAAPSPVLRLPTRAVTRPETPPECPRGQVARQQRDGSVRCVDEGG